MITRLWSLGAICLLLAGCADTGGRDVIRIVGSSTVFPFTTTVAEHFGAMTPYPTPVVESTGSGGGLKLFCAGVGETTPDIANASRRIKKSEFELCQGNGVTDVLEFKIGYDGIVIANAKSAPPIALTKEQLFYALAKDIPTSDDDCTLRANPYVNWREIDPSLPDQQIEVFGPPPTSGTRDAFVEIGMTGGARAVPCLAELEETDEDAFETIARTLREDGLWIDAGENDNSIIQTIIQTPSVVGVFGFSFLDQNADQIKAASVGGVEPTLANIAAGRYGISRSLYFYAKRQHRSEGKPIEHYSNA
ncbi:MAG: substrate-binding domain-containing protein, partial [Pseudomonadota bacterium]